MLRPAQPLPYAVMGVNLLLGLPCVGRRPIDELRILAERRSRGRRGRGSRADHEQQANAKRVHGLVLPLELVVECLVRLVLFVLAAGILCRLGGKLDFPLRCT